MNRKKKELQKQHPSVVDGGAGGSTPRAVPKPKVTWGTTFLGTDKKKSLTGLIEEQAKAMQGLEQLQTN